MKLIKKVIILPIVLGFGILPSFARLDGMVSKGHFYDNEKTIMSEVSPDVTIKTGKYWEKNLFYFGKYRPLFMLSNKELYNLKQQQMPSLIHRITTPSVYNISLRTSSIKNISLSTPAKITVKQEPTKIITKTDKSNDRLIFEYEQAKNPDMDTDKKVETAISLKNSKRDANYTYAIDLLDDVTKLEPYNAYAFCLKGEIYAAQKDFEKAMKNYVEALKINPTSKQCCLGIARVLENTNKELAQKYYDRAKLCEK